MRAALIWAGAIAASCSPALVFAMGPHASSKQAFVGGLVNPEDLAPIPGTKWIIASGLGEAGSAGSLSLIDGSSKEVSRLFPDNGTVGAPEDPYLDCPGAPDLSQFTAHGIGLRNEGRGQYSLFVVNHGGRESIEVFRVTTTGPRPSARWIGCVIQPTGVLANGVAGLHDGGIVSTHMAVPRYFDSGQNAANMTDWIAKYRTGAITGYAARWQPGRGWTPIAGTEGSGPNGIEVSGDGKWIYVANAPEAGDLARVPLHAGPGERRSVVKLGALPDNLRFGEDGKLWIAAAAATRTQYMDCFTKPDCVAELKLLQVDPNTLATQVVAYPPGDFGGGTTAVLANGTVWVGTHRGRRVMFFKRH